MATPKQTRDAAQHALHTVYTSDKDKARRIYAGLRAWVSAGWKPGMGGKANAQSINEARLLIGSLPANVSGPLAAYLTYPAKQLYDAKADGFIGPANKDADQIGPIEQQLPQDIQAGIADLPGIFSTLLDPDTWLRVAEVLLGGALIIVGLLKLTGASSLVGATPVGRVAKVLK